MPAAAQALGAVEIELPLPAIGPALVRLLRERGVAAGPERPEGAVGR